MVVIGLSKESKKKVMAFKGKIDYHHGVDSKARTEEAYDVRGIPHIVLMDPKGIVRWEGFPFLDGHELTESVIEKILKK
jgi:hypothetical protein